MSSHGRDLLTIGGVFALVIGVLVRLVAPLFAYPVLAEAGSAMAVQGGMVMVLVGLTYRRLQLAHARLRALSITLFTGVYLLAGAGIVAAHFGGGRYTYLPPVENTAVSMSTEYGVAAMFGGGIALLLVGLVLTLIGLIRKREQRLAQARKLRG